MFRSWARRLTLCGLALMSVATVACGTDKPITSVATVACGTDKPITPEEVLEKARKAMKDLAGYHFEYDYQIVKEGSSDDGADITLDGAIVADFQAPDRIRLRGGMVSGLTPGLNVDKEFDELWVGNIQYLRNPITGRWRTITYSDKYAQTVNEMIDIAPDSFSSLEFAEPESVDGYESFKLIATAPPGVYVEYYEPPPEVRVEFYIGKDDCLIRKFVFDAESYDDVKSHTVTYRFSGFDSPVAIEVPEVAPSTPPP